MKDIAVVSGQTARFECIVQSDSNSSVFWMKNNEVIQNSDRSIIEFRNGVCRLTIPNAHQGESKRKMKLSIFLIKFLISTIIDDAGTFECVAQNQLGADSTSAVLIIPGDKRGFRVY